LVGWPLVCEGVEAGGEGDGRDGVHGWRFAGWCLWVLRYVLDASRSVGVEEDWCCFVCIVALRLLRLTYTGRSPPGGFLYRSRVPPRIDGRSIANGYDMLWCYGRQYRLFWLHVCCRSCSIQRYMTCTCRRWKCGVDADVSTTMQHDPLYGLQGSYTNAREQP
jgi:hypothetical protein